MGEPVIRLQDVSKRYDIGPGQSSLRSALAGLPARLLGRARASADDRGELWALRDVSFEVRPEEVLGVIGPNGAGKTTILKLLSRITYPTAGTVQTVGRISSLIELAAGFHPELTGRENVYLNGAILGLSRKEIERRFREIVEFSGLERFLDTPVKRYSSGMWARLGFAVAVHVEPDILLVDEVLAVGDASFQYQCFERMRKLVSQNRAVVFVSHNLDAIQHLSQRVLWLDHGRVMLLGRPEEVVRAYLDHVDAQKMAGTVELSQDGPLRIERVELRTASGQETDRFEPGEEIVVRVHYRAEQEVAHPYFTLGVGEGRAGTLFLASMLVDGQAPPAIHGPGTVTCHFLGNPLTPGVYNLWGEVRDQYGFAKIVPWQVLGSFRILESTRRGLAPGPRERQVSVTHVRQYVPIQVAYRWEYDRAEAGEETSTPPADRGLPAV